MTVQSRSRVCELSYVLGCLCRISSVVGLLLLVAFYAFAHFMKIRRKNVSRTALDTASPNSQRPEPAPLTSPVLSLSAVWRRDQFIYLYMLVVSLNLVRDGVILFFYIPTLDVDVWGILTLVLLGIDALVVTPCTCYTCFWLHRVTAVSQLSV